MKATTRVTTSPLPRARMLPTIFWESDDLMDAEGSSTLCWSAVRSFPGENARGTISALRLRNSLIV